MRLPRINGIAGEAATLVSGNVLAQAISLLAYLVLTRLFTPADYALFNIFYSYIEVLIILSTCKYELAVVVARNDAEGAAVAGFALRLNMWVSLAMLAVVTVLYLSGGLPGDFSQLGWVALLIPPMVFFCGTSRVYTALFNRVRRYRLIAANATANAAAGSLLKMFFGLLGMHRSGLPLGAVIGQATSNLVLRLRMRSLHLPKPTRGQRCDAARRYRNFPLFVASKDFVNSLSSNLPFLWLALYFDKAEVGLFALALTFVFRPANLLNSAVERVLYARTAEGVRQRQSIAAPLRRTVLSVMAVALPVCVVAWFAAEPVFTFLFGTAWEGCGVYVQALLPWTLLSLGASPLTLVANVFSTQRTEFLFFLALLLLRVAAIAAGIFAGSFLMAIRLYAAAGALVSASLLLWYAAQVRSYERSLR